MQAVRNAPKQLYRRNKLFSPFSVLCGSPQGDSMTLIEAFVILFAWVLDLNQDEAFLQLKGQSPTLKSPRPFSLTTALSA